VKRKSNANSFTSVISIEVNKCLYETIPMTKVILFVAAYFIYVKITKR